MHGHIQGWIERSIEKNIEIMDDSGKLFQRDAVTNLEIVGTFTVGGREVMSDAPLKIRLLE